MYNVICITERKLCRSSFFERIKRIAQAKPAAVILREKDLSGEEYAELAEKVMKICAASGVRCVLHGFSGEAARLGCGSIHLPLSELCRLGGGEKSAFSEIGCSCHSVSEAQRAEELGCTRIIAGHIFTTDCKPGLEPRGLGFLSEVCAAVRIPVYAVGGITAENLPSVIAAGAAGGCVRSGFMLCGDVEKFTKELKYGR